MLQDKLFALIFKFRKKQGNNKYLGLPFTIGRSKKEIFNYLHDQVEKKLNSWKEKTSSLAAKEVLIKSVIQTIPTYAMSVFLLPLSITKSITGLSHNFLWGGR